MGGSFMPSFSPDGRYLIFVTHAENITPELSDGRFLNVVASDVRSNKTTLISRSWRGVTEGNSLAPSAASNGVVAFHSAAPLTSSDTNTVHDVFVGTVGSNTVELVSVAQNGYSTRWGAAFPRISSDGRFVAFVSLSTFTSTPSTNYGGDVYLRDLRSNTTVLVSVNAEGTSAGNRRSSLIDLTSDGRRVLFSSLATDLVEPPLTNPYQTEIYLRDVLSGSTYWVSTNAGALLGDTSYQCFEAAASADGANVIFYAATNGGPVHLLHHGIGNGVTEVVSTNAKLAESPQISATGELVAYTSGTNVYVWNAQTRSNILVNADSNGMAAVGVSHSPVLSPDARRVAFLSSATNLTANALNQRFQVYVRDLVTRETWLVSRNTNGAASNRNIDATLPAFSPDGQYVAFETQGTDLIPNDLNDDNDVFLHELASGETRLVSRPDTAASPTTALKISRVWPGSMNTNAAVIAFTSADNYLHAADTNQLTDIFVVRFGGATLFVRPETPASAMRFDGWNGSNPILSGDGRTLLFEAVRNADPTSRPTNSYWADLATGTSRAIFQERVGAPSVSDDGRWIAFESTGTPSGILGLTLIDQDADVFLYDTVSNRYDLVSRRYGFNQSTTGDALNGRISPDGRWILYQTFASDAIQTNFASSRWRVYARDMGAPAFSNRTELISTGPLASAGSPVRYESDYSRDSRFAVVSWRGGEAVLYDFHTGRLVQLGSGWSKPVVSDDGKFVAHESLPTNGGPTHILVKNVESGHETLLSVGSGAPGNDDSSTPQITPDGRFVFFESKASNLVENDTNGVSDIFLADRVLGTRMIISLNRYGSTAGNGESSLPVLSRDGRTLVFNSFASDLVAGDFNNTRDVFILHLGRPDSDDDGMDDDWEVAFFGGLSRNGGGDFDQDGYTDAEEFRAGTNPGDNASVLRVLTLTRGTAGGPTTVLWASAPGRTYRVEFKDDLNGPWSELGMASTFGSTGSITDAASAAKRFYRVVLIE